MKTVLVGLLAETSIHPGTGRSVGVVDLPVAREAATDYPVLVGSSLKGALRDKALQEKAEGTSRYFGKQDQAGELLVSDGRLLLLPVRSLTGAYRWVTCPHLIERFLRDMKRAGIATQASVPPAPEPQQALIVGEPKDKESLFLEEREFTAKRGVPPALVESLKELLPHQETRSRLEAQLVILHDDDFSWFVRYGLPIQARNVLDEKTKTSKNLWYEESLPPDTVMYSLVMSRSEEGQTLLQELLGKTPYLQTGGNETVGQGWFAVKVIAPQKGDAS